jgi:hypothetical protein
MILAVLCLFGAFLGSERAAAFFTTPVMSAVWAVLAALLGYGVWRCATRLDVVAAYAGCLFIMAGFALGGETGHAWRQCVTGASRTARGALVLAEGEAEDRLVDLERQEIVGRLSFRVRLIRLLTEDGAADAACGAMVALMDGGSEREGRIEPGRPLCHSGYHLYFEEGTGDPGRVAALLHVRSDFGVPAVAAGMVLLALGAAGFCWARPMIESRRAGRHDP